MQDSNATVTTGTSLSESQRAQVIEELNLILNDPLFKSSKRCVSLFSHLVQLALKGESPAAKERTLGIEVFGRNPNYDTSSDPIVRMTANEIRKRLAQRYEEPVHGSRIKISLKRGQYIPQFEFGDAARSFSASPPRQEDGDGSARSFYSDEPRLIPRALSGAFSTAQFHNPVRHFRKRVWIASLLIALFGIALITAFLHSKRLRSNQESIWRPLLESSHPLTICISGASSMKNPNGDTNTLEGAQIISNVIATRQVPLELDARDATQWISLTDLNSVSSIVGFLGGRGKHFVLRTSSELTLEDFRSEPAVLVGGFNNPWSLILLSGLRYSLRADPVTNQRWIQDSQSPAMHDWMIDAGKSLANPSTDYGLLTRFFDTETGQWVIAVSGIRRWGVGAASELITDPAQAKALPGLDSSDKNFQIVVKTDVIDGKAGPPRILAAYSW